MLKIAKSLVMMLAVAAVATGATGAYFTSEKTVSGMSFETGKLEITDTSADWTKHVDFEGLKPGDTIRKWVTVQNTGTLDVASLTVQAQNVNDSTPSLLQKVKVSVIGTVDGAAGAYYTPDWTGGATVDSFLTGSATNLLGTYFYSGGTPANVLATGKSDTIVLDFTIPSELGDSYQNLTASFDLLFHAEQSHTASSYF